MPPAFIAFALVLFGYRMGSLSGSLASPRLGYALAAAVFLACTHRASLARLHGGSESRFGHVRLLHRLRRRAP